jgi:hypothetical protein
MAMADMGKRMPPAARAELIPESMRNRLLPDQGF